MMALVTGGASCGKSAVAEGLCMALGGKPVYLAAMRPFGEEGARRVAKHRSMRAGKGFTTIECYEGLDCALRDGGIDGATVLLECLGNVVANEMFAGDGAAGARETRSVLDGVMSGIEEIAIRSEHLVIVGNEVGSDGCTYQRETASYQRLLGDLSRCLAGRCSLVVECCSGIPVVIRQTSDWDFTFPPSAGSLHFIEEAGD